MFLIYNVVGLVMLLGATLLAVAVGGIVSLFAKDDFTGLLPAIIVFVVWLTAEDVWYRWTHYRDLGWKRFIYPTTGGCLFYVPVWGIIPAIALMSVVIGSLGGPPDRAQGDPAWPSLGQ